MNNLNNKIKKLPLDNAAKIYPAAKTKKWNAVFCVCVHTKETIDVNALNKAAVELAERFPFYYTALKKGFFWDCLIPAEGYPLVEKDCGQICRAFNLNDKSTPLFRIVYSDKEIRVEFFHCLTDGTGAFEYLRALTLRYYENCRLTVEDTADIKTVRQTYSKEEIEDDFQNIYIKGAGGSRKECKAYQLPIYSDGNYLSSTKICLPIDELKSFIKSKYNCTITQYTATVYALAILEQYKSSNRKKPVKISIPVNLRPYFNSQTLRNFSSFITVNVTPQNSYTFENVLSLIKSEMSKKIKKENFIKSVSKNVADEKMMIARFSPNFIKQFFMRQAFIIFGEKKFTSTVTSMGYKKMPSSLEEHIDYFSAGVGETYINKINCAVAGFKNTLCINITCAGRDMSVQNYFINYIKSSGISCRVSYS